MFMYASFLLHRKQQKNMSNVLIKFSNGWINKVSELNQQNVF